MLYAADMFISLTPFPFLVMIYFIYYGLPSINQMLSFPQYVTAVLILVIYTSANLPLIMQSYIKDRSEIGSIRDVLKIVAISSGKEFLELVKQTPLISIMAITELFKISSSLTSRIASIKPILIAIAVYIVINVLVKLVVKMVENKLFRNKCLEANKHGV